MDLQEIGAQIRHERKAQKLTQGQLADELGMSTATISMLESGIIEEIGIRKVMRIMDRLGIELQARTAQSGYTLDDAHAELGMR